MLHYTPDRLAMRDGAVLARAEPVTVTDREGDHYTLGAQRTVDLAESLVNLEVALEVDSEHIFRVVRS